MKQWKKTMLLAAGILIALGTAVSIIATVLGATFDDVLFNNMLSYHVYDSVSRAPKATRWNADIAEDGLYEIAESVHSLCIDWPYGAVAITAGADGQDSILLEESGDIQSEDEALRYGVLNGTLYIEFCRREGQFRNPPEKTLRILLPQELIHAMQDVELSSVSADLSVEELAVHTLSLDSVSGELRCSDVASSELVLGTTSGIVSFHGSFDTLSAESTSGDIEIQGTGTAREACISTTSGSIGVTGSYGELEISSTSGEIDFTGTANTLNTQVISGAVTITGEISELEADSTSGNISLACEAILTELNVSTSSGDVCLALPETQGFSLTYDTVSGNLDSDLPLSIQGDMLYAGDGSAEIEISTSSGDLNLHILDS